MADDYSEYLKDLERSQRTKTAAGIGSGALTGASTGATIGSVIPGVGTAIGAGVGALVGGVAGGLSSAQSVAEKENAKRLKELLRKQELNQLGLSEAEKQRLYLEGSGAVAKAGEDVRAMQSGVAASLATGAGRAAIDRALQEEGVVRARGALEASIQSENLAEKARQEEEIDKRLGILSKSVEENRAATKQSVEQGLGAVTQEIERIKTVRGAKPSPAQLEALSAYTGMSPDQLGPALEYFASNPESATILQNILGAGSAGVIPR